MTQNLYMYGSMAIVTAIALLAGYVKGFPLSNLPLWLGTSLWTIAIVGIWILSKEKSSESTVQTS